MRSTAEQVATGLKSLLPAYLVCGDEPLQHAETLDAIRAQCKKSGYSNREIFDVEANFSWERFDVSARTLGLFAEKRLIELRFASLLPDKKAGAGLLSYLERVPEDTVLLVSCGKLAKTTVNTAWFQAFDRIGLIVQIWPLQKRKFLAWLGSRVAKRGLVMDQEALKLLARRSEGNMLAAAQEIDKLFVLQGSSPIDAAAVRSLVADSAHYDVFDLVDSVLAGQAVRADRILASIRNEGTAPQVVLWALNRELRTLAKIRFDLDRGIARAKAFREHRIWESRQPLIESALTRLDYEGIQAMIRHCARIDRLGKGLAKGDVWEELLSLSLSIAGILPLKSGQTRLGAGSPSIRINFQ